MTINLMRRIFLSLNMNVLEDIVFWLMLLAGFRGLLRKSNLCEQDLAVCVKDLVFCSWGTKLLIRRSKTITFGEQVFVVPFARINCSCFCFDYYVKEYLSRV